MKILSKTRAIQSRLEQAIANMGDIDIVPKVATTVQLVRKELEAVVYNALMNSPEVKSLMENGSLRLEFGLDDEKVSQLPFIMADLIEVYYFTESTPNVIIGFVIEARSEDDPVMIGAMNKAHYISGGLDAKGKNELIEWLRWLLFSGTEIINKSYKVYPKAGQGRSHMGIMVSSKDGNFSVDPKYAGTAGNNLISRAILASKDQLGEVFRKYASVPK